MRLTFIRHADPDYEHDSLTEQGWKEARALADRVCGWDTAKFYISPLGRAKDTASFALARLGREAEERAWLREFDPPRIVYPSTGEDHIAWDWLPEDWTAVEDFFDAERWKLHPAMQEGGVGAYYDFVTQSFDSLLAEHGYERSGRMYRAVRPSRDRLVFFCHFGLECVLLSHLLHISPMILWHGSVAAPSSVTNLVTEERRKGMASFRMETYGDISHLYSAGYGPSFAARFCETWDGSERHD